MIIFRTVFVNISLVIIIAIANVFILMRKELDCFFYYMLQHNDDDPELNGCAVNLVNYVVKRRQRLPVLIVKFLVNNLLAVPFFPIIIIIIWKMKNPSKLITFYLHQGNFSEHKSNITCS